MTNARPSTGAPKAGERLALLRATTRESLAFLLDVIAIARGDRHLIDSLLLSAIVQANTAVVTRQADLQLTYAEIDAPPPDEMRRPVSINALAQSLDLPFETVRRRVQSMARKGWVELSPAGAVVPGWVLTSPIYVENAVRAYERLRRFYYRLEEIGVLADLPRPTVSLRGQMVPVRVVARLTTDYVLRTLEGVQARFGDIQDALVVVETLRANIEHLERPPEPPAALTPAGFVRDELRRPLRIGELARRLGLPPETVRRRVGPLLAQGLLARTPGGLIVPADVVARPSSERFMTDNLAQVQRMFGSLAQLGVLEVWDGLKPPADGAVAGQFGQSSR